jgi:hypothetical protein
MVVFGVAAKRAPTVPSETEEGHMSSALLLCDRSRQFCKRQGAKALLTPAVRGSPMVRPKQGQPKTPQRHHHSGQPVTPW